MTTHKKHRHDAVQQSDTTITTHKKRVHRIYGRIWAGSTRRKAMKKKKKRSPRSHQIQDNRVAVYLTPELMGKLRTISKDTLVPMSALLRKAVIEYVRSK